MSFTETLVNNFFKATDNCKRKNIIIFESSPYFSDNTYWFFKYLAENTDVKNRYTLVWLLKDDDCFRNELCGVKIKCITRNQKNFKQKFQYLYYYHFAKFIVDCNSYVYKVNHLQKRVFLGHGMPFKISLKYDLEKGETDLNTITSYFFNSHFYEIHDTDENMRNFGYCRNDILAKNAGIRKNRKTTNIIWMPTYRQHSVSKDMQIKNSFPLGLPVIKSHEEMAEINDCLKKYNAVLYIRPHPAQDLSVMNIDKLSNIIIADNNYLNEKNVQLYEFLTETDALITDYSSIYYDYLMLERPIALAVEDIEEFSEIWPMYFSDFKKNYNCSYLYTADDLKEFIRESATDSYKHQDDLLKEKHRFHDYTDGKTCQRLYEFMKENWGL